MLSTIITSDFIKKFMMLNKKIADVTITHMLYGKQKIKRCVLYPFLDEERIGLQIYEEKKYIALKELRNVSINENEYRLKSDVMELYIML